MQAIRHCTVPLLAAVAALASPALAAGPRQSPQQAPAVMPATGEATYVVFIGGREIGREQVSLARSASGWTITSTGSLGAPINLINNRFEITYAPDWQPIEMKIEARAQDRTLGLATSFATTTAINEITQNGVTNSKNDQISARTVVLPNNFYAAYEALAVRLAALQPGADLPVYVAPQGEIRLNVRAVTPATFQTPSGTINARRFTVTFQNPGGPFEAEITVDDRNRFAKLDAAGGNLSVTRQDLAGVATRQQTFRNPTDTDTRIPAAGFSLAGTLTTPAVQGQLRHPGIVIVAGSGASDRDGIVAGVPMFAQLAGQLAERGFVVLRYDRRGVGQSGGRTERVNLQDYADDAIAAVKWLARRKDVDRNRIFVAGHGEGAAMAMLAAREDRVAGLVLMAGMGTTGSELILEQQQLMLSAANVPEAERAAKIELQKRILEAAAAAKDWEAVPADVRPLVDTPWYRSLLTFDPARVMTRIKQPLLILHGERDRQVPVHHAGRLAGMARARKKAGSVEVKQLATLNHLFVEAQTGEVSEYASLEAKTISADVAKAIADWVATVPR